MINVYLQHTCDNILHNISNLSEWRFQISVCGLFSAIATPYRYGSAVSLDNTYIHLHAVSRLVDTNCTNKPGTIEAANVRIECVVL